ncbi:hypothetical protein K1Y78_59940, partial [Streptomyces sp. tea 10]|nr:hypothetical protein [Streptomyces sp. tea 10]
MTSVTTEELPLAISSEDAERLFIDARTASHFTEEPVTEDEKRAIYDLTKMGPTASNFLPDLGAVVLSIDPPDLHVLLGQLLHTDARLRCVSWPLPEPTRPG